jgi:hypothetical protein
MNDFSDLEDQLKALRPAPLRESFVVRVEEAMAEPEDSSTPEKVIHAHQFRRNWLIGLSLAAAAAVLLLVRANFQTPPSPNQTASASPQPAATAIQSTQPVLTNGFVPTGTTKVVYHQRDEGLLFAQNREQPVRRLRFVTREMLQWKNPATGASLRVSYPAEQVELIPVSGQ